MNYVSPVAGSNGHLSPGGASLKPGMAPKMATLAVQAQQATTMTSSKTAASHSAPSKKPIIGGTSIGQKKYSFNLTSTDKANAAGNISGFSQQMGQAAQVNSTVAFSRQAAGSKKPNATHYSDAARKASISQLSRDSQDMVIPVRVELNGQGKLATSIGKATRISRAFLNNG